MKFAVTFLFISSRNKVAAFAPSRCYGVISASTGLSIGKVQVKLLSTAPTKDDTELQDDLEIINGGMPPQEYATAEVFNIDNV